MVSNEWELEHSYSLGVYAQTVRATKNEARERTVFDVGSQVTEVEVVIPWHPSNHLVLADEMGKLLGLDSCQLGKYHEERERRR